MRSDTPIGGVPSRAGPLVYLAEDDDNIRDLLTELFVHEGFRVRAAATGGQMFDWLFREAGPGAVIPDVIVTDHRMPGYCGLDLMDGLHEIQWSIPVIVITAYGPEVRQAAKDRGAHAVFDKPISADELRAAIRACLERPEE